MPDSIVDIDEQWADLCAGFERTRDEHLQAQIVLNGKIVLIAHGRSQLNPSMDEYDAADKARKAWEAVKTAVREFVKLHS